ncbi:Uncharacterized protein conserved in archaea [Escherichia coli]|uniref:Uncharacterized protein conserved in archaea n=1 Tax=Escherichia coli TaxID=562 RepID=A0A376JY08_ECOLX|nr:Uncharacterized protein conserved in archaea [Escherichia coli]
MTVLDYIAANPGCSGGEIAAALNTPTTAINAELRRLWRSGSVIRKERKNRRSLFLPDKPDAVRVRQSTYQHV